MITGAVLCNYFVVTIPDIRRIAELCAGFFLLALFAALPIVAVVVDTVLAGRTSHEAAM